ncbi:hypothetical protein PENSPDRAFT_463119 [Peniophora sp. CONT]|nr:hypothetical protein PENSPDRAFT_463119 [Peniophora sp. CONT]
MRGLHSCRCRTMERVFVGVGIGRTVPHGKGFITGNGSKTCRTARADLEIRPLACRRQLHVVPIFRRCSSIVFPSIHVPDAHLIVPHDRRRRRPPIARPAIAQRTTISGSAKARIGLVRVCPCGVTRWIGMFKALVCIFASAPHHPDLHSPAYNVYPFKVCLSARLAMPSGPS